jgi:outer membrane protein
MKHFQWQVAVALLMLAPLRAESQPIRVSLAEAIQRALAENPEVQIATLEQAASQQDRIVARSALLPQASVNADESVRKINVESLIGHQLPVFGEASGPFQSTAAGVAFSAPVFDLHLWKHFRAAKDRVDASRADAQTRREEISLLVVSQYLGILRAMASADAATSRVNLARALLEQAKALHHAGVATRIDEVRAEVKVRQEEQSVIVARTDVQTGLFGLARLLNVPPDQQIQVSDTGPFSKTAELPIDASIATAIRNRPELAAVESRKRAAESDRSAAAAESLPSLRFQGLWNEAGRNLPGMIPTYTYELELSSPLFTGGRLAAERRRAQLGVEQAVQRENEARNRISQEVKSGIAEWKAAKNEVDVANQALRLAHEELDLARGRFAAGVTDNIELVAA